MVKNGMRPVHRGEILRDDYPIPSGMSARALAIALHVPPPRVNDIIRQRRGITADTAMRLARLFGGDARSWLNLQPAYDLRVAEIKNARRINCEITPRRHECLESMIASKESVLSEDEKWSTATFRVWSDEMSPEAIAEALGLQPSRTHHKGDAISKRVQTLRKEHLFRIESPLPRSASLQDHLAWLCDLVEPVSSQLTTISDRCKYDIFCGFSSGSGQGGFVLDPMLLSRIAGLKINLVVDLYPPTVEWVGP